jgi:hypothetical protein
MKMSKASALVMGIAAGAAMVVPLALPAGAALKSSTTCKKESTVVKGSKVTSTIASCTPAALAAGGTSVTSVKPNQQKGTVTDTITWKGGKGKTVAVVTFGKTTKGKCKAPYDSRVKITGKVTSATGAAAKITKKGEPVNAFICAITKPGPKLGQTALEPGTTFKL